MPVAIHPPCMLREVPLGALLVLSGVFLTRVVLVFTIYTITSTAALLAQDSIELAPDPFLEIEGIIDFPDPRLDTFWKVTDRVASVSPSPLPDVVYLNGVAHFEAQIGANEYSEYDIYSKAGALHMDEDGFPWERDFDDLPVFLSSSETMFRLAPGQRTTWSLRLLSGSVGDTSHRIGYYAWVAGEKVPGELVMGDPVIERVGLLSK